LKRSIASFSPRPEPTFAKIVSDLPGRRDNNMHDDASPEETGDRGGAAATRTWRRGAELKAVVPSVSTDSGSEPDVTVELTAAVLAVRDSQPVILVQSARDGEPAGQRLPSGGFRPSAGASLDDALRQSVRLETRVELGCIDQLSTEYGQGFLKSNGVEPHRLSVGYLALTRLEDQRIDSSAQWVDCYSYLPWEDFRAGRPAILTDELLPKLMQWAAAESADEGSDPYVLNRMDRLKIAFGIDGGNWDDERVVDRFDIIAEAGLGGVTVGRMMPDDHRRIVCAALGRLRAKIRYRPVVFELLPPEFTLFELQKTVEAILGPNLHKQNFRRLVEGTRLVEPTGTMRNHTGGRPAKLFRFRHGVLLERPAPGVRVRLGRVG
jgi:hypothetical protein